MSQDPLAEGWLARLLKNVRTGLAGLRGLDRLTWRIDLIAKICHVVWTHPVYRPEGTTIHSVSQPGQIDMAGQTARLEWDLEALIIDVIVVSHPN